MAAGAVNSVFFGAYASSLAIIAPEVGDKESTGLEARLISFFGQKEAEQSKSAVFLAGCLGGIAQLVVACPVDLVKIKLQTQTGNNLFSYCSIFFPLL